MKRSRIIYIFTIIISILYLFFCNKLALKGYKISTGETEPDLKVKIVEITERTNEKLLGISDEEENKIIGFRAKILSGENKGEYVEARQFIDIWDWHPQREVDIGNKVLLLKDAYIGNDGDWVFGEYVRSDALIYLVAAFGIALILFAGLKGFNTLIALAFSCLSIFMVFIPAILSGKNIYLWTIITCLYIIYVTLVLVSGANKKSLSAAIGCIGGVVFSGILILISDAFIHITGFVNEESIFLLLLNEKNPIDLKAIVFGSIIIGCIGAMLDVSVDISSALWEVSEKMKKRSFLGIYNSGITIGKDTLGTMASTLVLAYIGSSLSIVLLLFAGSNSLFYTMNMELIVVEVMQAVIGSFGMLITIPLTSMISAHLYTADKKDDFKDRDFV